MSVQTKYPNMCKLAKDIENFYIQHNIPYSYNINDLLIVEQENHFNLDEMETILEDIPQEHYQILISAKHDLDLYEELCHGDGYLVGLISIMDEMFGV